MFLSVVRQTEKATNRENPKCTYLTEACYEITKVLLKERTSGVHGHRQLIADHTPDSPGYLVFILC